MGRPLKPSTHPHTTLYLTLGPKHVAHDNMEVTLCREKGNMERRIESLAKEIIHKCGDGILKLETPKPVSAGASAPKIDVKKKPGRAFIHKITGKYLAESGSYI